MLEGLQEVSSHSRSVDASLPANIGPFRSARGDWASHGEQTATMRHSGRPSCPRRLPSVTYIKSHRSRVGCGRSSLCERHPQRPDDSHLGDVPPLPLMPQGF
ncbi:hypothetical protein PYCCODRAFT_1011750 [Trametes coccinea BRFM310]|uniref:Uncharacterized protein n=1 Tax=Trametes coccinea (strain BRFM310) TaxID=1353009 RepID=A0A1Y2IAR6_TRAC3|nr:hypothetical protein PYCCODRAFT_1011750 [Trametes coccinea BRFM310]